MHGLHSLELGAHKQMRFCVSDGCGYVRKQQETQMVLTCCSSISDAWLLSMVCQQTLESSCLFALIPFLWKGLHQEEQTGNFSRSRPEEMSLLSLSPGSANLKLQRLTAAPSQSGSYKETPCADRYACLPRSAPPSAPSRG